MRPTLITADPDQFEAALADHQVYIRQATTEDGTPGFALMDSDGELIIFTTIRSATFFHAANHDLKVVMLN